MPRPGILPVLLVLALSICLASGGEARRRHHGYHGHYAGGERYSTHSTLDEWRRMRESGDLQRGRDDPRAARNDDWHRAREDRRRERQRDDIPPAPAGARGDPALSPGRNGGFGATIDKLVRGCAAQGAEFENWPFDAISRTIEPDENQRNALEALRGKAKEAGQRLSAECPRDVPAAPAVRLEAAEQGIAATLSAFDTVEPALKAFYAALNDEQKARLYREMEAPGGGANVAATGAREARVFVASPAWPAYAAGRETAGARETPAQGAPRQSSAPGWNGMCEELGAVLRSWPVREIERDVRLSGGQRVALYELVTTSLKVAETLSSACPAETALTPPARMAEVRARLSAVRHATTTLRPTFTQFYDALDQGQKVRFAGMH